MTELVACRGLICRLGNQLVLNQLDLKVTEGESLGLLGSSGSGKSTLLRLIAGLEIAEKGDIVIGGRVSSRDGKLCVPPHERGISMLFQDLALWPDLSVAGNVRLGLSSLRLGRAELGRRVEEALESCGISNLAARKPGTLSGGQQQRAALARALATRPRLLLLDEPLGGLDLITKHAVLDQIARLRAELGFAVILVTHDPLEVRDLCSSLAVLEQGRIVQHGALEALAANPQSELGQAFVRTLAESKSSGRCEPQN